MKSGFFSFFNVWPVFQRELREGSRRPVNVQLRCVSVLIGSLIIAASAAGFDIPRDSLGIWMFTRLHAVILLLIVCVVPSLAADGISREKREGTLGLLFLTPLSAGGVVLGNVLSQVLRAFVLWATLLPILTIPFTAGGITLFDVQSALSLQYCTIVVCLSAGMLASSLVKERNAAFLLAYVFSFVFLFIGLHLFVRTLFALSGRSPGWEGFDWIRFTWQFGVFMAGLGDSSRGWNVLNSVGGAMAKTWIQLCLSGPIVASFAFFGVARFAARTIERSWKDNPVSARRERMVRRFCTPLFLNRFQSKARRTLGRNPIAWLQEHSWKVRTAKWGLCLSIVLIELGVIYAGFGVDGEFDVSFAVMLGLFGAIYSFIGVNGFLEEKRSGALELILVTPLKPSRLIYGRVLGLWNTFMPAAIILAGCHGIWWWLNLRHFEFVEEIARDAVLICAFFTLPIFATYFALRLKNLILAGFFTWLALCIPPFLAYGCTNLFGGVDPDYDGALAVSILVVASILFSLLTCFLIHHSLSRRIYPF